jgi:protease II
VNQKWMEHAAIVESLELLFKTDMDAGHGGRSGRLGSIEESAEIMGWLIAHANGVP